MRVTFAETLCDLAAEDDRIWLLTGDLGFSVLERFPREFPARFANVGIAEQNMMGIAAGLAMCGKMVFVYSIANFTTMRCLEQVRNDICYHNLDVRIVAVGGGMVYGSAGYTHHALEDLAVMRVMPHMKVIAPGDPVETRLAVRALARLEGPCYLRLGKSREQVVHVTEPSFEVGKAISVMVGQDLTLISTGGILATVVTAAHELVGKGYSVGVLSMPTVCPLDGDAVLSAADRCGRIISVEEHGPGGLGSAVAEVLATGNARALFRAIHSHASRTVLFGSQDYLLSGHGLSQEAIIKSALDMLDIPRA